LSVEWEVDQDTYQTFLFTAAESLVPFNAQLNEFRTRLFGWFAFLIACLLAAQAMLMRWVLKPLRKIASEVREIDKGTRDRLSDDYPTELLGVTTNTNTLIQAERSRLARYKKTLGNLAHSLKTPLAVIQTATEQSETNKPLIRTQVKTMNDIVGYQLKRAATVGQVSLGREPVNVMEVINKILSALKKVYFDKQLEFISNANDNLLFSGDYGDLTEVIGNLLDNAAKWAESKVVIHASELAQINKQSGICLIIEDDGKGIDETEKERIMQRGQRADENIPGYGIGLSMVKEIAQSYQGSLSVEVSDLGGARFIVRLPAF
jgi:two-component system sensor histidine kinase PhoQ